MLYATLYKLDRCSNGWAVRRLQPLWMLTDRLSPSVSAASVPDNADASPSAGCLGCFEAGCFA